ncbi:MAG: HEAT repeat domain-containing protein [candidate division Zixibacteria bacterium]|nr:HEAT repeat domain-containing protein [candidate division Zixibacteria bacterium]
MISRAIIFILALTSLLRADTKSEIDRLFMQASSGEVRYRDLVQPARDSLIALGDSAAKYLALKLNSTDARERHTLVDIFGAIGPAATPYLLAALNTDNNDQLRTTARCLGEVKDTTAIADLLRVASHNDYTVRSQAVTAIGKIGGDDRLAATMTRFASDSIELVRKSAVVALRRIRSPSSVTALIAALDDDNFAVRLTAVDALLDLDTLATPQIIDLLETTTHRRTQALALRLIGELELFAAMKQVEKLTDAADPMVRGWAFWSWGRLRGPGIIHRLRSLEVIEDNLFVKSQLNETIDYLQRLSADE